MFALGAPVQAALIGAVDHGTYFTDTTSGLDWLDVTASVNRSYSDVSSQFGTGGDFDGWRYATAKEFGNMVDATTGLNTGISALGQIYLNENEVFAELIALLGSTFDEPYIQNYGMDYEEYYGVPVGKNVDATLGWIDPEGTSDHWFARIMDDDLYAYNEDYVSTLGRRSPVPTYSMGSYLVRNSGQVPEPSVIALLVIGLAGFGVLRHKNNTSHLVQP